jgi:15-cis-phytoene desaturase
VIAGGGLAGLTCAKVLVDRGVQVEVLEGMPFLGGRASTFRDPEGEWIEQGLHLFLGVYSEFRKLLRDIGQPPGKTLFWHDHLVFEEPRGPRAVFGVNPLYAPLRTIAGVLGNNEYLGLRDKLALIPLLLPALRRMRALRGYDDRTVEELWAELSGSGAVLERILRPFCRAIQFTNASQFSAYNFLGWIHHTIYDLAHARLGGYEGARDETIFQPLARYLEARGAVIHTNTRVKEILFSLATGRVTGLVRHNGVPVMGDAYVAAIPPWLFAPLVPAPLRALAFFANIEALPVASAISVQLWFDRVVTETDDFHLVAKTVAAVYQDQAPRTYANPGGSRLSVIVAPADELLSWEAGAIVTHVLSVLGAANPSIAAANLTKAVVLKHPRHLVRPLPGAMTWRPTQVTPVPNLFLAGDWTQQDFFGSQEGAVRGGKACATEILARLAL